MPRSPLESNEYGVQDVHATAREGLRDAYELFAVTLSYEADRIVSAMLRNGPHSPRVTVGDLTVSREQWQIRPEDMPFLSEHNQWLLFARMREWASGQGMPRFMFYKSPGETKPCYLDLNSPLYVGIFAKLMRRLRSTSSVRLVEMLPGPDEVWLADKGGARYTSEVRIVARRREECRGVRTTPNKEAQYGHDDVCDERHTD